MRRWGLTPDGARLRGHMASVWPVRGPGGERWVLKVTDAHHPPTAEAVALRAWRASGAAVVDVIEDDGHGLLLERLDATRDLAGVPDADRADSLLADAMAGLGGVAPPAEVPRLGRELSRVRASILEHRRHTPQLLPGRVVDRAVATLTEAASELEAPGAVLELVHLDLHYLNVLRTLGDDRWVVIDPLPQAGWREIEVVAPLRNRWDDVLATGEPDAALRRRLALLCDGAGLDRVRAAALAQAVAVDNLLWLLPRDPTSAFVPPYQVLSGW